MVHFKKITVLLFLLICIPVSSFAADKIIDRANVKAALLVDLESGKVLYLYNEHASSQSASLSKILTLYLVNEDVRDGKG